MKNVSRSILVAFCVASVALSSASGECSGNECGGVAETESGGSLLQSRTRRVQTLVAADPKAGSSETSAAGCPGDVGGTATEFWKVFFEEKCEVEWSDVGKGIKARMLKAMSMPTLKSDGTTDPLMCEVLVTMPGENGAESGGDLSFTIMPSPAMQPVDENWDAVPGTATYHSHLDLRDPCAVFGPAVPRVRPMVASKIEEIFGQLKDIYAETCGVKNRYKLSLSEDSSKPVKKAKEHMTQGDGTLGFSFDIDLYVDSVGEPMSTHIKVNAPPLSDEERILAALTEAEQEHVMNMEAEEAEKEHEEEGTSETGEDLMQTGKNQKMAKQYNSGYSVTRRAPRLEKISNATMIQDAAQAYKTKLRNLAGMKRPTSLTPSAIQLPITGPWTVDREEIQPPLCCLCSGCPDNTVCTEGGQLEGNASPAAAPAVPAAPAAALANTLVPPTAVVELGRTVWKNPAPRGVVPAHGSAESRQPPVRHGNLLTVGGTVAKERLPSRNPLGTGDTFHATVLPKRGPADHERIWAQSRALIAIVKSEQENNTIPESYNFFDDDVRSQCWKPAYSQGECGSCWAFASLGALEKQMCLRAGADIKPSLSREHLVRCSTQNNGCMGGNADKAYEDLMEIGGVFSTDCLPYQGKGSKHCPGFAYSWFSQDATGKTGRLTRIDQELKQSCGDHTRFTNRPPMGKEWDMPFRMMYEARFGTPLLEEHLLNDTKLMRFKKNYAKSRSRDNVAAFWLYGEEAMRAAVVKYGSIYASYKVMDDFKERICCSGCWPPGTTYGEEAYILNADVFQAAGCAGCGSGHAVHVVGFGEDIQETGLRVPYWLIENSWGTEKHGDLMGVDTQVKGFTGVDPWSTGHPMGVEDKCIIGGWASSSLEGCGGGRTDIEMEGGPPDGFWLSVKLDGKEVYNLSVEAKSKVVWSFPLKIKPGDHNVTLAIYAGNHPKKKGVVVEHYSLIAAKMRCRGMGYRYSFHQNDTLAHLSWGRLTRKQLRAKADAIMKAAGVPAEKRLEPCPESCRTGSFSEVHPCLGLLMSWGSCYDEDRYLNSDWYQQYAKADCRECEELKLLEKERQEAVKKLDNETFSLWHGLVQQAFDAPDDGSLLRPALGSCELKAGGFAKNCKLDATYAISVPYGSDGNGGCDETHSAPYAKGEFVSAPGYMASGAQATTRCPMPKKGSVTVMCENGVLSAVDHDCSDRPGTTVSSRGYFKMLRGHNYHGIEDAGAFAMAEMSRFLDLCPTTGWTKWSECTATVPCTTGLQKRSRQPVAPLTTSDLACGNLDFHEERSCVAPGLCPQVLARMIAGSQTEIPSFMSLYKKESISLPYQTAGAHMLPTVHQSCTDAKYWCSLITGTQFCGIYFEGHFEVKKSADYFLRYEATQGGGEILFNTLGEGKEGEPEYKVKASHGSSTMYEWQDYGFHHRRRRTEEQPWEQVSSVKLHRGKYYARMTRAGWHTCPDFSLKLEQVSAVYTAPILHTSKVLSAGGDSEEGILVEWENTWGAVSSWILGRRESDRRRRGYAPEKEKGLQNEIVLRDEYGGNVVAKSNIDKLNYTADELYELLGITNRLSPKGGKSYRRMELLIRSTLILPESGTYKIKYQQDTSYDESNIEWRSQDRRRTTAFMIRAGGSVHSSIDEWGVGSGTATVSYKADNPGDITFEVSSIMDYDGVNSMYTLPNFLEVEIKSEDMLHGSSLDFGSTTNYMSDVEAISGGDGVRIDWPDRDNPLDNEIRMASFQSLPRDSVLVGTKSMLGFMAHAEGVIDAGACLSLQARVPSAAPGEFGGLALELCDIDAVEQYLELVVYKAKDTSSDVANDTVEKVERNRVGWVHIGFTQPTHLKIVRSPTDLGHFVVSYRPDNREEFALPFDSDKVKELTNGYTGEMDVGISMFTPEAYRYAEFYNVSLNPCPGSCDSADGTGAQVFCGTVTTACGNVLSCSPTCPNSGICQDNVCMECPELSLTANQTAWECGSVSQVCTNHEKQSIQVHREVGSPAPSTAHYCVDNRWTCTGKSSWAYMAEGLKCGSVANECGDRVTLPGCLYPNDECVEHTCLCTPTSFPDDYNCGWASDGCGSHLNFGDPLVMELQLACGKPACFQEFHGLSGYPFKLNLLEDNAKYQGELPDNSGPLTNEFDLLSPCKNCGIKMEGWIKAPATAEFSFVLTVAREAKVFSTDVPYSKSLDDMQVVCFGNDYGHNKISGSNKLSWEKDKHYYVKAIGVGDYSTKLRVGLKQEGAGGPEWMPIPLTMFEEALGLCSNNQDVCDNHRCCTPYTAADFPADRDCGNVSDGCGGLVVFGTRGGKCPGFQACNHSNFTCEKPASGAQAMVFAIMDRSSCAERLPYGPAELTDESTNAFFNTGLKDMVHTSWLQVVRPYGAADATADFSIEYQFKDEKTLKDRFVSLTSTGELVNWAVQSADGDTFNYEGKYYFSNNAQAMASKFESSGKSRFSQDDGAWGAGRGTVNGNSRAASDFWGVANWNSGDSGCSQVWNNGILFAAAAGKEIDVKSFMYVIPA